MPKLLSEAKAAKILGLSRQTLAKYRGEQQGPRVKTVGRRNFYRKEDLEAWTGDRGKK